MIAPGSILGSNYLFSRFLEAASGGLHISSYREPGDSNKLETPVLTML